MPLNYDNFKLEPNTDTWCEHFASGNTESSSRRLALKLIIYANMYRFSLKSDNSNGPYQCISHSSIKEKALG